VLKRNISLYKKKNSKATNLQQLRDYVKSSFGFNAAGTDLYLQSLMLQTIGILTSEDRDWFPASFFKCCKDDNETKSTQGILNSMGYSALLPAPNKIKYVAGIYAETNDKGQPVKVVQKDKDLEHDAKFYAAVKILLPLIKESDKISIPNQLKDTSYHLSNSSQSFYKKHGEVVDELGIAYAFAASHLKSSKKKTKSVHVINKIGYATKKVNRQLKGFTDASNNTYDSYMDIRYSLRKAMEKFLNRRMSPKKRKVADTEMHNSTEDTTGAFSSSVMIGPLNRDPPKKRNRKSSKNKSIPSEKLDTIQE
jgi:hypothetical protein